MIFILDDFKIIQSQKLSSNCFAQIKIPPSTEERMSFCDTVLFMVPPE